MRPVGYGAASLIKINDKKQRCKAKGKKHRPEVRALAEDMSEEEEEEKKRKQKKR